MAVSIDKRKRASSDLKSWLDDISQYEKAFKEWESRADKIVRRYQDKRRQTQAGYQEARYNILWANTQTLIQAVYSRVPQPDVSRRFRDNDPVGRVAAMMLERALQFEIEHYSDYRTSLRQSVQDRFLAGRGTTWVRYEPQIGPADDLELTEDVEDEATEELKTETSPVDYVHWRDFGHSVARTWEEVSRVWRVVYMEKDDVIERFGKQVAALVPMDAVPEEFKNRGDFNPRQNRAKIYEGWDKRANEVVWLSKGVKDLLDRRQVDGGQNSPPVLEDFFPCPQPLYATISTDSLEPVPDFTLYQDQARELDILADRIDGLVKALKVTGTYDASQTPLLARLFTEGDNNNLLPVDNWAAFVERNGLAGAINIIDLRPIAAALQEAYLAFANIKGQIDEITGISDIIRGQTAALETATATLTKGQYASLRLRGMQEDVSRYATDLLRLKAQIICNIYSDETLIAISGAKQLEPVDQQLVPQALQMLRSEPTRNFRIEVAADSMVRIDEEAEKRSRVEFLGMVGKYLQAAEPIAAASPQTLPLLLELLKFGVTAFKVGRSVEGLIDSYVQQVIQNPPQPQPNPKAIQAQTQVQVAQVKAGAEQAKAQSDIVVSAQDAQAKVAQARAALAKAIAEEQEAQGRAMQAIQTSGPQLRLIQ